MLVQLLLCFSSFFFLFFVVHSMGSIRIRKKSIQISSPSPLSFFLLLELTQSDFFFVKNQYEAVARATHEAL